MDVRASIDEPQYGQVTSYVIGGICVFIISVNLLTVGILCLLAKDGHDALFAGGGMKLALKCCGFVQMTVLKIVLLPLLMLLISIPICTSDRSLVIPPI